MANFNDIFSSYLAKIFEKARSNVREESYYSVLEDLLNEFSIKIKRDIKIDSFPKQTEAGNPDIRILNGNGKLIGYIEAKDPRQESLETIEDLEQLDRYRKTFPNLILTNFCEFRLYRNGALLGKPVKVSDINTFIGRSFENIPAQSLNQITQLFKQFLSFLTPRIYTPKALAIEMAKKTRFLRDEIIQQELIRETNEENKPLLGFYQAFKEYLISSLTKEDFANLYAQTIAYGLFIARHRYEMKTSLFEENNRKENILFTRDQAYKFIQPSLGILRELFKFISSEEPSSQLRVMVDDIADLLAAADLEKVVKSFYKDNGGRDPIIHFYETFLAEYDSKEREKRGVYYTPEPVVSYIVRSVHSLLKEKFSKEDGLATSSVTVLDPAAGTLTFPAKAITLAVEEYKKKYGNGGLKGFIKEHILEDFYAFELMMAPYAIGHLKIDFILDLLGYKLGDDERFKYYLTNTLEMEDLAQTEIPTVAPLSKESQLAGKVKRDTPILVIIGNPPYSVSSSNVIKKGSDFYKLYESYKEKVRKEEKNIQPLSDDYIKFLAFAHWKIKQTGEGIIGMITNNSYLDGLIHRDIRRKFMEDFDEIYILNLHGNLKRQEKTPEGGKDENVFDIQQGVCIVLLIKDRSNSKQINYADLWGLREEKYSFLDSNDVFTTKWKNIEPKTPHNFFTIKDFRGVESYDQFIPLDKIFKQFNAGVATGKDDLLVSFNKEDLVRRLSIAEKSLFDISLQNYKIPQFLIDRLFKELKGLEIRNSVVPYSYRPFDTRYVVYNKRVLQRARDVIMGSFLKPNLGLVTTKQLSTEEFRHVLVTNTVSDRCLISLQTREVSYIFPLYIYNDSGQQGLLEGIHRSDNLQWGNLEWLETLQSFTSSLTNDFIRPTEAVFYYVYAILYSIVYREKYQEFLKIDFPRIPLTRDYNFFKILSALGKQLVDLHLLNSLELGSPISKFYGKDSDYVEKPEFKEDEKRIYINNHQYFDGVKPEVWNYYIGGYQVPNKWLKDRKGRILSLEDIKHYCKVVTALSKTINIQKEIDKLYPEVEKSLI